MTHNQLLLKVLRDGKPHSHLELYALGMIVHSRIADLRGQGHVIKKTTARFNGKTTYFYTLLSLNEGAGTDGSPMGSPGWEPAPSLSESGSLSEGERAKSNRQSPSESELVPLFEVEAPTEKPAWA